MSARQQPFTFDRVARIIFTICVAGAILWLIYYLRSALLPFGVGCMIAYMAEPLVQWNMRWTHLKRRIVPVLLSLLQILIVAGGFVALFLPEAIDDCHKVGELLHRYAAGTDRIPFLPESVDRFFHSGFDLNTLGDVLHDSEMQHALSSAASFFTGGLDAVESVVAWAVVFLYVLFILINYPGIMNGLRNMVPPKYRSFSNPLIDNVSGTMKRYFRTQALIASIAGVLYVAGFSMVGLPLSVAWGVVCAVLFMVPYVVYLAIIPITLLCIVVSLDSGRNFWEMWLECVAVFAVVQSFSDLWLTPRFMSKSMNLDPAVILLSLSVWGTLLGFLGVILALPLTTIAITYYRHYILGEPALSQ
ncbi:MAG: AI-2E family transporter [Muribaculaceae bacterium]|nr:AI-2E family transporter [Muribaculaceae bacterium]